jgi:fatty acid desaturase
VSLRGYARPLPRRLKTSRNGTTLKKEILEVRDEIKKKLEQREASAPAWWVSLLPLAGCVGLGLVVFILSFLF